jgi:hypothetical protein
MELRMNKPKKPRKPYSSPYAATEDGSTTQCGLPWEIDAGRYKNAKRPRRGGAAWHPWNSPLQWGALEQKHGIRKARELFERFMMIRPHAVSILPVRVRATLKKIQQCKVSAQPVCVKC